MGAHKQETCAIPASSDRIIVLLIITLFTGGLLDASWWVITIDFVLSEFWWHVTVDHCLYECVSTFLTMILFKGELLCGHALFMSYDVPNQLWDQALVAFAPVATQQFAVTSCLNCWVFQRSLRSTIWAGEFFHVRRATCYVLFSKCCSFFLWVFISHLWLGSLCSAYDDLVFPGVETTCR